jgi:hypothetical protein
VNEFDLQISRRLTAMVVGPSSAPLDKAGNPIKRGDTVDTPVGRGRVWGFHASVERTLVDVPGRIGLDAVTHSNCTVVHP